MTTAALGCFFAFALVFSAVMSLLTCFFKVARSFLAFAMSDLPRRKAERCSNEIKYQHVLDVCRCCSSNVHIPNEQSFLDLSINVLERDFSEDSHVRSSRTVAPLADAKRAQAAMREKKVVKRIVKRLVKLNCLTLRCPC